MSVCPHDSQSREGSSILSQFTIKDHRNDGYNVSISASSRHLVDNPEMPANPELRLKVIDCIARGLSPSETIKATGISNGGYHKLKKNAAVMAEVERRKKELAEPKSPPKAAAKFEDRAAVSVAVEVVEVVEYRGPGHPSKLNAETKRKFMEVLRAGCSERDACGVSGIAYRTFLSWIQIAEGRSARPATPEYVQFLREYEEALAHKNSTLIKVIRNAAVGATVEKYDGAGKLVSVEKKSGDYRAAALLLDRSTAKEKADIAAGAEALMSENLERIYGLINESDRIPEEYKRVFFEILGHASGGVVEEGLG